MALGGFMGSGKSTVGRALAERLGVPFQDSDEVLTRAWGPIADQFASVGEAVFRDRERAVVLDLAARPGVLATGGGVFADDALRRSLAERRWLVNLDVDWATVQGRLGADAGRPLLADGAALLGKRAAAYADVDRRVDGRSPVRVVVDEIVAWLTAAAWVPVSLGDRSYPVVLWPDLAGVGRMVAARVPSPRVVVVTDDTVGPLWAGPVAEELAAADLEVLSIVEFAAGESNKTLSVWSGVLDRIVSLGVDRQTTVVALGGGVAGDLAGFAAATALRGIGLVQIPTTLLAMVDSSVGGKTGVNHAAAKNLIGAFHQPTLVAAPLNTLQTLDGRVARSGLGEVVKTAVLAGEGLFERVEGSAEALAALDPAALAAVIAECVRYKAGIVAADEREAGLRAVLNLGHTLGHAVETACGHGALHHGEAVMIGLVAEARFAVAEGICDPDLPGRLARLATRLRLPVRAPTVSADRVLDALALDKKRGGARLNLPVPISLGQATTVPLSSDRYPDLAFFMTGTT